MPKPKKITREDEDEDEPVSPSDTNIAPPDYDKAVRAFINIRNARAEKAREWERVDAEFEEKLNRLRVYFLAHLNLTNVKASRTDAGTFFKKLKISPSAASWEVVYKFIKDNDAFDMLERRLKKKFITDYRKSHNVLPPGVNVHEEWDVQIRSKS
jgi:hypothetical protein